MSEILVGTRDGLHVVDGHPHKDMEPVVALAVAGDVRWALVGQGQVLRSNDEGWDPVTSLAEYRGRCLLPTDRAVLIGTAEAHLYRLTRGALELAEDFEEVDGRSEWYTPWGGPPDIRSMSTDDAGTIYVNVHVGGIVRRRDGAPWEPTIDIDADVHQVQAHPIRSATVLAACARGLATSVDGGDTWQIVDDGLHGSYARAVAVAGEAVLLTASTGPFTKQAAIYRSSGGDRFERCTGGLPEWFPSNIDSHCLSARGSLAAFGTDRGEVWVSEDEGQNWVQAVSGLSPVTCLVIA